MNSNRSHWPTFLTEVFFVNIRQHNLLLSRAFCKFMLCCFFCVTTVGCASVSATRTTEGNYDEKGLRYWLPMPFLLIREPIIVSQKDIFLRLNTETNELTMIDEIPAHTPQVTKQNKGKKKDGNEGNDEDTDSGTHKGQQSASPISAVDIIYLPDYCHQYALQQTSTLATLNANSTFGDGWKLLGLDSKSDSTQIIGKVVDLITAVKTGGISATKDTGEGEEAKTDMKALEQYIPALTTTGSHYIYWKKSTLRRLKPGIYEIFTRVPKVENTSIKIPQVEKNQAKICNALPVLADLAAIVGPEETSYSAILIESQKAPPHK